MNTYPGGLSLKDFGSEKGRKASPPGRVYLPSLGLDRAGDFIFPTLEEDDSFQKAHGKLELTTRDLGQPSKRCIGTSQAVVSLDVDPTISSPRSSPDLQTEPTQGRATRTVHGITLNRVADSIRSSGLIPAIQSNNRDVAQGNYLGRCMVKEQSASIFAPLYSAAMTHNSHSRQTHTTLYSPN